MHAPADGLRAQGMGLVGRLHLQSSIILAPSHSRCTAAGLSTAQLEVELLKACKACLRLRGDCTVDKQCSFVLLHAVL